MKTRRALGVLGLAGVMGFGLVRLAHQEGKGGARQRASELHAEALDQLARLNLGDFVRLQRASLVADPSYLPAVLDLISPFGGYRTDLLAALHEVARLPEHPLVDCARHGLEARLDLSFPARDSAPEASDCARYAWTTESGLAPAERRWGFERLWASYPDGLDLIAGLFSALVAQRDWARALELGSALEERPQPLLRVMGLAIVSMRAIVKGRPAPR